jgi:hypothetical protein
VLPEGTGLEPNLKAQEGRQGTARAISRFNASKVPGIIDQDWLRRNLLSSQPLCFHLFRLPGAHPDANTTSDSSG